MGHTYFIKEGHREEKEMFIGKSTDLPVINIQKTEYLGEMLKKRTTMHETGG